MVWWSRTAPPPAAPPPPHDDLYVSTDEDPSQEDPSTRWRWGWRDAATKKLATLAKPPGALGNLERWAVTLCAAQKTLRPSADPIEALVFVGDHGTKKADAALSPYPASATRAIFKALAAGASCAAVLARANGVRLVVVDVGIDGDVAEVRGLPDDSVKILHRKVARGTRDSRSGPAMSEEQFEAALRVGRDAVANAADRGCRAVCVGEVGIGNTTSAAALLAALSGADAADCCGRGTGLDDAGLARKVEAVRAAVATHADEMVGPNEALRRLGGLEIAAMVGAYLEASERNVVAVVDGSIAAVAALFATRLDPTCDGKLLLSTGLAEEPGAAAGGELLDGMLRMGDMPPRPALDMDLRLGEASGAILAAPLLRAAAALMTAATLEEALALP